MKKTVLCERRFKGTYRLHLPGRKISERGTSVSKWLGNLLTYIDTARTRIVENTSCVRYPASLFTRWPDLQKISALTVA
jgi:hypothetical protein